MHHPALSLVSCISPNQVFLLAPSRFHSAPSPPPVTHPAPLPPRTPTETMRALILASLLCGASSLRTFQAAQLRMSADAPQGRTRRGAVHRAIEQIAIVGAASTAAAGRATAATTLENPEFRGMNSMENPGVGQFRKISPSVAVADVKIGDGDEVVAGSQVTTQWVLRRANGYFIDSSVGAPVSNAGRADPLIFKVGAGKAIKGYEDGILGMRAGGVRRLLVGPSAGYVDGVGDGKPGPMPDGFGPRRQIEVRRTTETFFFEVSVTKVRSGA